MSIDRAVPIGLILNETAINSIKHAFGPEGGRISVSLEGGIGYGEARLTVTDNGRGIRNLSEHGSGLKLITSLAKQIGGTIEQKSSRFGHDDFPQISIDNMITGSEACRTLATAFRLSVLLRASLRLRRLQGLGGLLLQLILKSTSKKIARLSYLRPYRSFCMFILSSLSASRMYFIDNWRKRCISPSAVRMRFEPKISCPRVRARFESLSFDSLRRNLDLWFPISVPPQSAETKVQLTRSNLKRGLRGFLT